MKECLICGKGFLDESESDFCSDCNFLSLDDPTLPLNFEAEIFISC